MQVRRPRPGTETAPAAAAESCGPICREGSGERLLGEVQFEEITLSECVGRGGSGVVYKVPLSCGLQSIWYKIFFCYISAQGTHRKISASLPSTQPLYKFSDLFQDGNAYVLEAGPPCI